MKKQNANTYEVKKLRMPVSISITSKNKRASQSVDPDSLFALTMQKGMEVRNGIGKNLRKHNILDFSCLHGDPDRTAFERMAAFSLLYKSELGVLMKWRQTTPRLCLSAAGAPKNFLSTCMNQGVPWTGAGTAYTR